ncbi:unnamed protein product [Symbiodinium sp. CCMP2592]|nr:unnamed protein product [Symbiodinium sp. CCMP2592]
MAPQITASSGALPEVGGVAETLTAYERPAKAAHTEQPNAGSIRPHSAHWSNFGKLTLGAGLSRSEVQGRSRWQPDEPHSAQLKHRTAVRHPLSISRRRQCPNRQGQQRPRRSLVLGTVKEAAGAPQQASAKKWIGAPSMEFTEATVGGALADWWADVAAAPLFPCRRPGLTGTARKLRLLARLHGAAP